ncbi:MAG TPA: hypothetical protein VK466_16090 [Terriglobales bacterium]|jgi:hypothetical protein|nr:hypothetical protein [Terriglobales bacterium]
MATFAVTYSTPEERRDYERAIAFVAEMRQLGLHAPHGGVIDACEALSLSKGRDFLRETLAGAVEARVSDVEKNLIRHADIKPATKGSGHGRL